MLSGKILQIKQTQKTNLDSAQNQNSRPNTKTHSTGDSSSRRLNGGEKTNPDSATENLSLDLSQSGFESGFGSGFESGFESVCFFESGFESGFVFC